MRIALHNTGTIGSGGRGFGVYTQNLFNALSEIKDVKVQIVDVSSLTNDKLKRDFDVIHYPSFDFFFHTLPDNAPIPRVVTIHDTIPLIYPMHYPPGIKGRYRLFQQKKALKNVEAIVTDSNTSQKDIVRFLNIPASKIFPVYLGPSIEKPKKVDDSVSAKYGLPKQFVLYIGDVNWNKNVVSLAKACSDLKIHLVIVGKKAAAVDFDRSHIENRPLVDLQESFATDKYIHRIGFVEESDLASVLKKAALLCQPSYYEGFGLSVLDAMSLGIPTLCAHTQALVEIYGSASEFFDPYKIESLKTKLTQILESKDKREKLSKAGLSLSKTFSWEKAAKETVLVYKGVCQ